MTQHTHATTAGYQFRISRELDDPEWDRFVASVPGGHHVQTSRWGRVKGVLSWEAARVVAMQDDAIAGGAQLLIRPVRHFGNVGYVTKGPVTRPGDQDLIPQIIGQLRELGRSCRLRFLAIQPPDNGAHIADCLQDMKFGASWLELAPTATIVIDLTQEIQVLMERLKRQTRQNIRRSRREGITVREGTAMDLDVFYRLHESTSTRQQFVAYPQDYFSAMWQAFEDDGQIALIIAEYRHEPVSALLLMPFGTTVIAKILGWSGEHGSRRPNEAVFWESIKWSQEHGYQCFDMEGIDPVSANAVLSGESLPDEQRDSPDFFKLGFGGQVVLNPIAYDFFYNPVLNLSYRTFFKSAVAELPLVKRMLDSLRQHN